MINYVCKYAPVELFKGFGQECAVLEEMPENFDKSDKIAHANLCGFGKSVIQAVLDGKVDELVLVNCCDSMRRVYDIIENTKKCKFLYMLDLPHEDNECENIKFAQSIIRLKNAYERYSHRTFDRELFIKSFAKPESERKPYIGLMGVHVSSILEKTIRENMQMDVENMTCTSGRNLIILQKDLRNMDDETLFVAYAESLLGQMPCARMNNNTRRNQLFLDPSLKGIIYHTIKFCDYYGFEYASIKNNIKVPLLKLETDFTSQSAGQLLTRIQAFAETIEGSDDMDPTKGISEEARRRMESGVYYVAGIDSGSTSTDVVILDQDGKIKSTMIIPTGGGAMMSAEKSLEKAVEKAGISKDDIVRIVTTGYGRAYINSGDDSITEITCHAKGAHYLNHNVRTVIDIGGQDIKAISIDENGDVNVHKFNGKIMGTGGFVNIVAGSKKVVLCGTLRAGKLLTTIANGKITIDQEGKFEKMIKKVESVTFSAKQAALQGQEVIYITERAVFKLLDGKVVLTEIAPGMDLQKDIIDQMGFVPVVSKDLKEMDACIFKEEKMNIYDEFIGG